MRGVVNTLWELLDVWHICSWTSGIARNNKNFPLSSLPHRLSFFFILKNPFQKRKSWTAISFPDCDALSDLVPFVQFKKREKHPWRSVTLSKIAGFTFFKLYKWYQIAESISYIHFTQLRSLKRNPDVQHVVNLSEWGFFLQRHI